MFYSFSKWFKTCFIIVDDLPTEKKTTVKNWQLENFGCWLLAHCQEFGRHDLPLVTCCLVTLTWFMHYVPFKKCCNSCFLHRLPTLPCSQVCFSKVIRGCFQFCEQMVGIYSCPQASKHLVRRHLDPKDVPKTPNLRRYTQEKNGPNWRVVHCQVDLDFPELEVLFLSPTCYPKH